MDDPGATSANRLLPLAAAAARAHGPGLLSHVVSTGSTNTDLAGQARRGSTAGAVLVTDHQTAGRGRLDRTWNDEPGAALLVSFMVPAAASEAPALVRALGTAAREAAASAVHSVRCKWPNDLVVIDGPAPGKLAGVLAEFVEGANPVVIVGLGLNLTAGPSPGATSLAECGADVERDPLLAAVISGFAVRRGDDAGVLAELRQVTATLGERVRADLPGGHSVVGVAVALDDDGALVLDGDDGTRHVVTAGDVVHLRPG